MQDENIPVSLLPLPGETDARGFMEKEKSFVPRKRACHAGTPGDGRPESLLKEESSIYLGRAISTRICRQKGRAVRKVKRGKSPARDKRCPAESGS